MWPDSVFPDIRVAMREIDLSPSAKEGPVGVYDPSGPFTDPNVQTDIRRGLAELRRSWVLDRGDVEDYAGREVKQVDNGLREGQESPVPLFDRAGRRPLRAKSGANVTQLHYARRGIITPEMEYVAIRENLRRQHLADQAARDGEGFGASVAPRNAMMR